MQIPKKKTSRIQKTLRISRNTTRKRTLLSDRKHLTDSRSSSKIFRKNFGGINISYIIYSYNSGERRGQGRSCHPFFNVLYPIFAEEACASKLAVSLSGHQKPFCWGLTCAHLGYVLQTFALHRLLELLQMKQESNSSFSSQCRPQHDYIAQIAASTDASRRYPQARFSKIFVVHGALVHKKPAIRDPSITALTSTIL